MEDTIQSQERTRTIDFVQNGNPVLCFCHHIAFTNSIFCIPPSLFNYILLVMLLRFPNVSSFCLPLPSTRSPPLPQTIPTPLFMSMGHVYKFFGYSISYTVIYSSWLTCKSQFVLFNPLTSSPISPYPHPNHQNDVHIHGFFSVLFVCLVCFFRFNC